MVVCLIFCKKDMFVVCKCIWLLLNLFFEFGIEVLFRMYKIWCFVNWYY